MSRVQESQTELFASAPLSKVLEIALLDLEKIERSPKYIINMSTWYENSGEECNVCFAGCVMASTLAECPIEDARHARLPGVASVLRADRTDYGITPARYKDARITKRLRALDLARRGFKEALPAFMDDKLDYAEIADSFDEDIYEVTYEADSAKFKSSMKKLAGELRAKGY